MNSGTMFYYNFKKYTVYFPIYITVGHVLNLNDIPLRTILAPLHKQPCVRTLFLESLSVQQRNAFQLHKLIVERIGFIPAGYCLLSSSRGGFGKEAVSILAQSSQWKSEFFFKNKETCLHPPFFVSKE